VKRWRGALAAALALCAACGARAEPSEDERLPGPGATQVEPPRSGEEYMLRLFTVACVSLVRDPRQVAALAQAAQMPPIEMPYGAMFLEGQRGAAWSASNRLGRYVLSVREDGSCAVHARKADNRTLHALLEDKLLAGIGQHYTVSSEGPTTLRDGPTRQTWVAGTGQKGERLQIHYVAARADAPFVAVLTARMLRTAPAAPRKP
jgi:hypothetical protein